MSGFRRLFVFVRPFLRPLIAAAVLTGLLTVIGMAPPLLMRRLINDVAGQGRWDLFALIMGLLFAVPVLRALVNVANSIVLNHVGLGIISKTRKRLFRHLMRLSMRFYDEMPAGGVNQRLMGDVAAVSGVVTGGIITLLTDVIAVAFAVAVMFGLSWALSLLTLGLLPLYYVNYRYFAKRIRDNNAALRSHMDHISSSLQERLSAHELMQSYGQERAASVHFSSRAKQIMDAAVRGSVYSISFTQLSAFINKIGNTLIYGAGCYFFVKGSLGYGDVIAFCAYATQLLGPVVRFSAVANQLTQVGVSVDRLNQILDRPPAIAEPPDALPIETLTGAIRIDGVTFGYRQDEPVLQRAQLDIPAGTHLAVVGPAGAGRSTLAMLLRRFYDPQDGRIEVDGTDIRQYRLRDYRRDLALVLPESAIFDGTIRENVCYGKPEVSEERMTEVCKAIGLHEFVADLANGYDTRLGAGGLRLSAGNQQRVGIARALLSEPAILIADEATGPLDPDSAHEVLDAIHELTHDRTCVLIAQRVLMTRGADLVAVMENGQVVESGTHDELLGRPGGAYRSLFGAQYGTDRLPPTHDGESV